MGCLPSLQLKPSNHFVIEIRSFWLPDSCFLPNHITQKGFLAKLCPIFALSARNCRVITTVSDLECSCLSARLCHFWRSIYAVSDTNLYFIKQSSLQALLSDIRATHHLDVFITCCCFCLCKSAFDAVGDEGIHRSSLRHPFWNIMREDKYRELTTERIPLSPLIL